MQGALAHHSDWCAGAPYIGFIFQEWQFDMTINLIQVNLQSRASAWSTIFSCHKLRKLDR